MLANVPKWRTSNRFARTHLAIKVSSFKEFGEHVTIDTMVLHGLGNRGNNVVTDAIVFYDLATGWLETVPVKSRNNAETLRAFHQVFGKISDINSISVDTQRSYAPPNIREVYCDKAKEFISVCKRLGIPAEHSTPGMPRTNAVVESKVKLVLHGGRVALRQAGLEAKFWPYACRHFCLARDIEMRDGSSAYRARFGIDKFAGQVWPFGCLIDFFPTPARKKTRRNNADEVVLGDGDEYALPADPVDAGELIDVEVTFDDDGFAEWFDAGDEDRDGVDITVDGKGKLSSYQRAGKFSPTSRPGIFLGYHFEIGGKWNGDYLVADLEDFNRDAGRASVHQVKRIYSSPKELWTFPMLAIYDKRSRTSCIDDPAMQAVTYEKPDRIRFSDEFDETELFDFDQDRQLSDEELRKKRDAESHAESSHGGNVDFWDYDPKTHKWTYHVIVPRKAMVHPSKTPGALGVPPNREKLSSVRISHVQYAGKSPATIREEMFSFGKTRLMQLSQFYDEGFTPKKMRGVSYQGPDVYWLPPGCASC